MAVVSTLFGTVRRPPARAPGWSPPDRAPQLAGQQFAGQRIEITFNEPYPAGQAVDFAHTYQMGRQAGQQQASPEMLRQMMSGMQQWNSMSQSGSYEQAGTSTNVDRMMEWVKRITGNT